MPESTQMFAEWLHWCYAQIIAYYDSPLLEVGGKFGEFPESIHKKANIWVVPENLPSLGPCTKLISCLMDSNNMRFG